MSVCQELPVEAWQVILPYVPIKERLGSCSLVNQTLHKAAAAATVALRVEVQEVPGNGDSDIDPADLIELCVTEQTGGCLAWLHTHGQSLTRLELFGFLWPAITKLPCLQLQELELAKCKVQLAASSYHPGVLQGCSGLTHLGLIDCEWVDLYTPLGDIPHRLPHLQSLRMSGMDFDASCLPEQLVALQVERCCVEGLKQLNWLSALCDLDLCINPPFHLTPSLTPGGFRLPASLQDLTLKVVPSNYPYYDPEEHDSRLNPAVLRGVTSLTYLCIAHVALTSGGRGGSGASFLEVLDALQQLQSLKLFDVDADWPAAGSLSYSALVPSSTLTSLEVYRCTLPDVALRHVFTPGRLLPRLQWVATWQGLRSRADPPLWDQAAVSSLVSCCPGLQHLSCCLQQGTSVAALKQLSALTALALSLGDAAVEDATACVQAVAALTNLQALRTEWDVQDHSMSIVSPLTALTKLTHLSQDYAEDASVTLHNEVREGERV